MDTQNSAVTDVPEMKLAKVGKGKRERKRGGAGWFGSKAGSGFSGALGGSGAGAAGVFGAAGAEGALGFGGMSLAKILLALLVGGGLSAGAWQIGKCFSGDQGGVGAPTKKVFSDKGGQYADTSGVIKPENSLPNSLGYVSGSLDGMTPEERAKKATAAAEAARKAAEADEAARKAADEEEARKAKDASPAGRSAVDPGALAGLDAAQNGFGANRGGGRLGGGLSGLGGLNGGRGAMAGGSGLSGGINQSFGAGGQKGMGGSLASMRGGSKPTTTTGSRAALGKSKAKGFAKRQLDNAFTQSRQAVTAGKTETAASGAAVPFDGTNSGGGTSIGGGPGVTSGSGGGHGTADGGTPANSGGSGGGTTSNTNTDPGPACDKGFNPNQDGVCVETKTEKAGGAPDYQWMIKLAQGLIAAVVILSLLCLAFKGKAWFEAIAQAISVFIGILGVAIAALGIMIMASSGDKVMGGIFIAIGALVAAVAFWPTATSTAAGAEAPAATTATEVQPLILAGGPDAAAPALSVLA
jgi:hypothetical protein